MVKVQGWKIYYGDGSTFGNDTGPWESAPSDNVQAVGVRYDNGTKALLYYYDYYYLKGEGMGVGFEQENVANLPPKIVKSAKTIPDDQIQAILAQAQSEWT